MVMLLLADVAADLTAIKNLLIPDIIAWGAAAIGLGLTAAAVLWIMRIVRAAELSSRGATLLVQAWFGLRVVGFVEPQAHLFGVIRNEVFFILREGGIPTA